MTMVQSYQQSKSCSYSLSKASEQFRIQIIPEKKVSLSISVSEQAERELWDLNHS
jgi:hypothetical protein